jgi:hypothetical protein
MRRLLLAVLAATALLVATPLNASATSAARTAAAVEMARDVGHHGLHGPAPDRALVLGAWHHAGVDTSDLTAPDALVHACTALKPDLPRPDGPAPGDYALYRDAAGTERIGMFLSQLDVAIVDQGAVVVVPHPELNGDIGQLTVARLIARPGSLRACRLAASRWPGGMDDTGIPNGRVALADPAEASAQLKWSAEHPRDADNGFWHPIQRILASLAAGLSGLVSQLIQSFFDSLHWLLEQAGDFGAPFLLLGSLLARSFDGRRLHAILTGLVVAALAVLTGFGFILPFGWVIVGAVLGGAAASAAGVPVLGAIGGAMVSAVLAAASFLTGALTGIDNSDRVTAGSVVFALIADMLWLRPALLALGAATRLHHFATIGHLFAPIERLRVVRAIAGHGRSTLDIASNLGDALALRPHAITETAHNLRHGWRALRGIRPPIEPHILSKAVPVHRAMSVADAVMSSGRRGVDLLSLTWRPSSISSDLVGHAADALHLLDTELRTGLPSMPRLHALLTSMDPQTRKPLLDAAAHVSTHAVPQLRVTARLSHLHSGARTLIGVATDTPPHRAWTRLAHSPVLRRVLRGLPEAGR